jgi:hypothetical protein
MYGELSLEELQQRGNGILNDSGDLMVVAVCPTKTITQSASAVRTC